MSTIRCIYEAEPSFPATDQHLDAVRYLVSGKWVDAIGEQPTAAEVATFGVPTAAERSTTDTAEINRSLMDEGTVFRAMAEVQYGMLTGGIVVNAALTKAQYRAMLKARMRTA